MRDVFRGQAQTNRLWANLIEEYLSKHTPEWILTYHFSVPQKACNSPNLHSRLVRRASTAVDAMNVYGMFQLFRHFKGLFNADPLLESALNRLMSLKTRSSRVSEASYVNDGNYLY